MAEYKVTNTLDRDVYLSWNTELLDSQQRAEWEAYKQTVAYKGSTPELATQRNRMPEMLKFTEWIQVRQLGEFETRINPETGQQERVSDTDAHTKSPIFIPKFKIPAKDSIIVSERQMKELSRYAQKDIEQKLKPGETTRKVHTEGWLNIDVYTGEPTQAEETVTETKPVAGDIDSMSYAELIAEAKARGLKVDNRVKKEKILKLLK